MCTAKLSYFCVISMLEEGLGDGDETNVFTAVDDGQAKNCEKNYCDNVIVGKNSTPIALPIARGIN